MSLHLIGPQEIHIHSAYYLLRLDRVYQIIPYLYNSTPLVSTLTLIFLWVSWCFPLTRRICWSQTAEANSLRFGQWMLCWFPLKLLRSFSMKDKLVWHPIIRPQNHNEACRDVSLDSLQNESLFHKVRYHSLYLTYRFDMLVSQTSCVLYQFDLV